MKQVITLYHHLNGNNDMMLNISVRYGIRYDEAETADGRRLMLFSVREKLADRQIRDYLEDVLCYIFHSEPANLVYDENCTDYDVNLFMM